MHVHDELFSDFELYMHIHDELSWQWDPSQNMKFTYLLFSSYTSNLKVFCIIFLVHLHFDITSDQVWDFKWLL